ncbi:MAG: ComEC/Rec2 family competence protein, partial [Desulfovibrio sp.]
MPLASQNVCLTRPVLPLHGFYTAPVSFYELSRRAQGIFWRVWSRESKGEPRFSGKADTLQAWRASLRDKLVFLLENSGRQEPGHGLSEAQALLPALLFGDRFYLRQATTENFSLAAIAHSLALSGQHLAIAGLLGLFCIAAAARFHPAIYLWPPRVILVAAASCPAALLYLWIGNAPPSLLRAACMM